jgi:ATP-binding cassette subfamily B protein
MWKFLWELFKPYKWWGILMLQAPLLSAICLFASNYSLELFIDGFSGESSPGIMDLIYPITLFLLSKIGLGLSWRLSNFAEWRAEPFARRRLLLKAYDYIQHHSYRFFQNTQSGLITSKLRGLLDGYDYILNLHHTIGSNVCIIFISIFVLLFFNFYVFIFTTTWIIILFFIMYPMCLHLNLLSLQYAESNHKIMGLIADNVTNIFSLFFFSKRKTELKHVETLVSGTCVPQQILLEKYNFRFALIFNILYWIMLFSVLIFLIILKKNSHISTGVFLFIILTIITISSNLWDFITGLCEFIKKMGDFKASYSILETPYDNLDSPSARDIPFTKNNIEFKNIIFSYEEENKIFNGLKLSICAGEKVGIVGPSGAGKSTLISLLLKNFKLQSGQILVGGRDIEDITSDSLRKQISLIPQDTFLFHRTIAENIGYGVENPSLEDIKEASRLANIDEFIESLPAQYATLVGERGVKLSGGQRQRIAIARAILKNSPVIILDEATSSLDVITESKIQEAINLMLDKNKATIIAIAHRLSTIRHMDRIVVMDKGKIIEEGSFNELIKKKEGYFKALWDNQNNNML